MQHWCTGEAPLIHVALHWHIPRESNTPQHPNREDLLRSKCHDFSANSPSRWHLPQHSGEVSGLMRWEEEGEKAYTYIHTHRHTGEQGRSMSEPEQRVGGVSGGHEKWTHREADAHGGGEGPCDELALVKLNQQGGLAHSAVPHQDGLQTDLQRNRGNIMQASALQLLLVARGPALCGHRRCRTMRVFIGCSVWSSVLHDAVWQPELGVNNSKKREAQWAPVKRECNRVMCARSVLTSQTDASHLLLYPYGATISLLLPFFS